MRESSAAHNTAEKCSTNTLSSLSSLFYTFPRHLRCARPAAQKRPRAPRAPQLSDDPSPPSRDSFSRELRALLSSRRCAACARLPHCCTCSEAATRVYEYAKRRISMVVVVVVGAQSRSFLAELHYSDEVRLSLSFCRGTTRRRNFARVCIREAHVISCPTALYALPELSPLARFPQQGFFDGSLCLYRCIYICGV